MSDRGTSFPETSVAGGTATSDVFDAIAEATSSATRYALLTGLLEAPGTRRALADRHGVSRSTMHRHLKPLQAQDWVEQSGTGEYRLTAVGAYIARALVRLGVAAEQGPANEPFLEVYRGEVPIPPAVLADATTRAATPHSGQQAARTHLDIVDSGVAEDASVRLVGGTCGPVIAEVIAGLREQAADLEIVLDEQTARSDQCELYDAEQGRTGGDYGLLLHPEPFRFGLVVFGDRLALVGAYDETGHIRASCHGRSDTVLRWAERTYETLRARARPVE